MSITNVDILEKNPHAVVKVLEMFFYSGKKKCDFSQKQIDTLFWGSKPKYNNHFYASTREIGWKSRFRLKKSAKEKKFAKN